VRCQDDVDLLQQKGVIDLFLIGLRGGGGGKLKDKDSMVAWNSSSQKKWKACVPVVGVTLIELSRLGCTLVSRVLMVPATESSLMGRGET
jgi:hypothetical protein